MGQYKIAKLLNDSTVSKFATKKWITKKMVNWERQSKALDRSVRRALKFLLLSVADLHFLKITNRQC